MIKVRVNACTLEYYKNLGYNVEMNKPCLIKLEDLSKGNTSKIKIICDYCGKEKLKSFRKRNNQNKVLQKDACIDCFKLKQQDICFIKYGVKSVTLLETMKDKTKQTNLKKYGCENPMQSEIVKNKFKNTMQKKYGCNYAQQNIDIKNKTSDVFLEKYGVKHPFLCDDIKKEYIKNFKHINGIRVSKNQFKLAKEFNGSVNTNISGYYVDILLLDKNIIIEYNGSGHYLSTKNGKISLNDFMIKEEKRIKDLQLKGYKCFIIENKKEKNISINIINDLKKIINNLYNQDINYLKYEIS
jgi:very-short-patch-repair endonuclease